MKNSKLIFVLLLFFTAVSIFAQQKGNMFLGTNLDTVKAQRFDTGKMWTFEDAPVEYFKVAYGFEPSQKWLDDVRLSALKFASWCSSSFVSEDGLIMTNHHCVDFVSSRIQKDGEDIAKNGFYADSLSNERKIPGVFVDQLVLTKDVSDEINDAVNSAKTDEEKLKAKNDKISDLVAQYSEDTGLKVKVVSLYSGGKYSLYGYKRYNDIRAVYINESEMGLYGGDPDNFTYPRYNPDFAFVRAYDENGKPLHTDHFFKWSKEGPKEGEPLFVVGNPGRTERLKTVAQLEYARDFTSQNASYILNGLHDIYQEMMNEYPARFKEFESMFFFTGNSAKVYKYVHKGLMDPVFMARKKDFEKKFKAAVNANRELKAKYGQVWTGIENTINEMRKIGHQVSAYAINPRSSSKYFLIASDLVKLAKQLQLPESERKPAYQSDALEKTMGEIFPDSIDTPLEMKKLKLQLGYIQLNLGNDNELVKSLLDGKSLNDAVKNLKENSVVFDKEKTMDLIADGPDEILESSDPIISFIAKTTDKLKEFRTEQKEIRKTEETLSHQLGKALFAVYGTSIPPDATFTLRLSDGMMKSYQYNGTEAPTHTTFYGLYNRYYSHGKKYPWNLPERWLHPKEPIDLDTPLNFISTCDIIGGNSGSAVINKNAEIVGVAFDGNVESIPGNFIYTTEANRTVSVASQGILEILNKVAGAKRIAAELVEGKIPEKYKN